MKQIPSYAIQKLHVNSKEFLADVKQVLKGTGFSYWQRGRNPDRKQFIGAQVMKGLSYNFGFSHAGLRQSLPLNFASYVSLYVRRTSGKRHEDWQQEQRLHERACGRVEAVAEIYRIHGKTI